MPSLQERVKEEELLEADPKDIAHARRSVQTISKVLEDMKSDKQPFCNVVTSFFCLDLIKAAGWQVISVHAEVCLSWRSYKRRVIYCNLYPFYLLHAVLLRQFSLRTADIFCVWCFVSDRLNSLSSLCRTLTKSA